MLGLNHGGLTLSDKSIWYLTRVRNDSPVFFNILFEQGEIRKDRSTSQADTELRQEVD